MRIERNATVAVILGVLGGWRCCTGMATVVSERTGKAYLPASASRQPGQRTLIRQSAYR